MTDTAPVIASPNDIDAAFADRAFVGTSWTPERRGYLLREDYANDVNKFYAEVWPRAQTPEQKTLLGTEMERYRDGALARMKAYLASHANVVSSFIAGPSKFPAERMRKRGAAADRKMEDLLEWRKKAKHSIIGKLRDARTPEMRTDEAWEALRRTLSRAKGGETSAKTSVFGKLERLAANGEHELVGRALDWLAHQTLASGKPVFTPRHKIWCLGQHAKEAEAAIEARSEKESELVMSLPLPDGIELWANYQADRAQLVFPGKPDSSTREHLKKAGWRCGL